MSVFHTGKEVRQGSASLTLGESRRGHDPPLRVSVGELSACHLRIKNNVACFLIFAVALSLTAA
jgi:hypothetical protein